MNLGRMNIGKGLLLMVLMLLSVCMTAKAQNAKRKLVEHLVRKSETVYSIAQRYGTTVDKVYELNPWAKDQIKDGDKLLVLTQGEVKDIATKPGQREHTIASGETLYRVARNYRVTEEALMSVNPGVTAGNFPVGRVLRIPIGEATQPELSHTSALSSTSAHRSAVRVLLMLPLTKVPRYLEFYRGFLMGINDLKKDGISIHLKVIDVQEDETIDAYRYPEAFQSEGYHLIFGGVSQAQIEGIGNSMSMGYHIVPFVNHVNHPHVRMIQINQSPRDLATQAATAFIKKYGNRNVYFVGQRQEQDDQFVQVLKQALTNAGVLYRVIDLNYSSVNSLGAEDVIVPQVSSKALAEKIMSQLSNREVSLFGYPQWQSYDDSFIRNLHMHRVTIYSSFYFETSESSSKVFLSKYHAWYKAKLMNSFPRYGVLGYDMARYFIRAQALLGGQFVHQAPLLTPDGLQMDISITNQVGGGYVNRSFYFVTYEPNGSISRLAL